MHKYVSYVIVYTTANFPVFFLFPPSKTKKYFKLLDKLNQVNATYKTHFIKYIYLFELKELERIGGMHYIARQVKT